jgi:hypothetical protein
MSSKSHVQHEGELYVQRMRAAPREMPDHLPHMISDTIPRQHATFFEALPYLPLGTLDAHGRPWATLLSSPQVSTVSDTQLNVTATVPPDDPFVTAVLGKQRPLYFAGVGVDFTNRRRNKLAGTVKSASLSGNNVLSLSLVTDENMGNCPKYITVRKLAPVCRAPGPAVPLTTVLDAAAKHLLNACSTAFLATRHLNVNTSDHADDRDMGFNHRGGAPGFMRYYEDAATGQGHIVLPDYSGNQFYQVRCLSIQPLPLPPFPDPHPSLLCPACSPWATCKRTPLPASSSWTSSPGRRSTSPDGPSTCTTPTPRR